MGTDIVLEGRERGRAGQGRAGEDGYVDVPVDDFVGVCGGDLDAVYGGCCVGHCAVYVRYVNVYYRSRESSERSMEVWQLEVLMSAWCGVAGLSIRAYAGGEWRASLRICITYGRRVMRFVPTHQSIYDDSSLSVFVGNESRLLQYFTRSQDYFNALRGQDGVQDEVAKGTRSTTFTIEVVCLGVGQ